MTRGFECRRAEELFSDHLEGTLPAPLSSDLEEHLARCADCRVLLATVGEVIEALKAYPVLDPPATLAERAAAAAMAAPRPASRVKLHWPDLGLPTGLQALAAALALALTGAVLLAATEGPRLKESSLNAAVYLTERKDRVVEDFRLLRVVVTTAFEGRLDRVNDRVDDYRRLLEKRRATEQEQKRTGPPKSDTGSIQSAQRADFPRNFFLSNPAEGRTVTACDGAARERPRA